MGGFLWATDVSFTEGVVSDFFYLLRTIFEKYLSTFVCSKYRSKK